MHFWTQAQKLKNEKSLIYKMCETLGTKLRFALTGTPMQNNHGELYNLLHLCALLQAPCLAVASPM